MNKAQIIADMIAATGLSVRAFAEKCGIPYTTLRSILSKDIGGASVNNVIAICKTLGISIDELDNIESNVFFNKIYNSETLNLINKYNRLDDISKELVHTIIDIELKRTENNENILKAVARNGKMTEIPDSDLISKDIESSDDSDFL